MKKVKKKNFADLFEISDSKTVKIDREQLKGIIAGEALSKNDNMPITAIAPIRFTLESDPITTT